MKTFPNLLQQVGLTFLLLLISTTSWAINLTPNSDIVTNGQIPGTYSDIYFTTYNGNWTRDIKLPKDAEIGTTIRISSNAASRSFIQGVFTGLAKDVSIPLLQGQTYLFAKRTNDWGIYGDTVVRWNPNSIDAQLPTTDATIILYSIANNNWAPSISFPASAPNNALLIVKSHASRNSSFSDTGVLAYANHYAVKNRDSYIYQYNTEDSKWFPILTPAHYLTPDTLLNSHQLPRPTSPLMVLSLSDSSWTRRITLPAQAFDRDRIRITSTGALQSEINHQGVEDNVGSLLVNSGDVYEFMYVESDQEWKLIKSPVTHHSVKSLFSRGIPSSITPNTHVTVHNRNWNSEVRLSRHATNGDRVTITSGADLEFEVTSSDSPLLGAVSVSSGEEIQFLRAENRWVRATETISMLLVYSDAVANSLGENGARARMYESFRLTNTTLHNSKANARLKLAGIVKMTISGNSSNAVLGNMPDRNSEVQTTRAELSADAVYYVGTQTGVCGRAYVNDNIAAFYNVHRYHMVAVGKLGCGTTVMRHEFGHNMGLEHCRGGQNGYGHGYKESAMCRNSAPYYSTPSLYDDLLRPRGIENQHDAVRVINQNTPYAANFY
ncbi:zinc-dependent metalloprotease family protein [Pelagibaculum spongiae]|uniref:Metalloprotease StcE beta-sandwich domain-containing protein n=1 Tax=Pelagibaculum spongiae TaxID=2080658 RepID=A0A2V1GY26_9GAMM|nr:zinc-dependent metalloprotease family protein [Pelagibaculum spongiae]PVZ66663.1 hypothetical protein DC094_15450 [Pelagibaculum spongiae]